MKNKKEPTASFHTSAEKLVLETIRLKALKFELKLLKAAQKAGRIPTSKEYLNRMFAATLGKACAPLTAAEKRLKKRAPKKP